MAAAVTFGAPTRIYNMGLSRYSWVFLVFTLGLLLMEAECDSSVISVKLLKKPQQFSNLDSAAFSFQVLVSGNASSSCTSCTTSCKLDDLRSSDCAAGEVSYSKLQDGDHKFEVCNNGSHGLSCATYNWTIDTVPPTASVAASTSFTSASNVSVFISFTEPCGGFRCLSVNECSLLVYGAGQVIPTTLETIQTNLRYSILVNLSSSVEYGRVILVMDRSFCQDAAGNQFTRTASSSFAVHFDRRSVFVDVRTRIPEQLLQLDTEIRTVQATNRYKNLKLYLYFSEPILNSSIEVLKSLQVSQGSLASATLTNNSLGNRRFAFRFVDISDTAIVTVRLDSRLVLSRQGTSVSPVAPLTFLYDSQRPYVRLSTRCHMRTRQKNIPVMIKFMKPVFGFNSSLLSISGGQMMGFREINKSIYSIEIQPMEDMISVHVPENVTADVAGNKNLQSNILELLHYSVPMTSMVLAVFVTAIVTVTALVACILTVSTACLQRLGAFATPSPLLTSSPARILFRILCYLQIFALSGWLAVPLPVEYYEFAKRLRWSIPYLSLPWETSYVLQDSPMNPYSDRSQVFESEAPKKMQLKAKISNKADSVYGLPLTAMEYRSFFVSQHIIPEAEYLMDSNNSHRWRDFGRSMFWLAVIGGGLILLHIFLLVILKLRKRKANGKSYGPAIFPRFEIFLVILALPCVSAASAALLKGGSSLGIAVGVLLLGTVFFLLLSLFMFLSNGISCGKLLQYKEVHHEGQKIHWYQELVRVTLGPGKRGQWTWINATRYNWVTILGPLFEDLRGPPKYMLSQIIGGHDRNNTSSGSGSIIASDDENEDTEAPFVQKVFGILRIYYIFLESVKRVCLGILAGAYSRNGYSETPTIVLLCITSFQLFFMLLKKPFIKKKVQLVEIISVSSQVGIFAIFLVLLRKNLSIHDQTKIAIVMLCLFLFAFVAQMLNEWNSLIRQTKQLDPDRKSFFSGLKIAFWGILLLFVPLKSIESQFPLKCRMMGDDETTTGGSRGRFGSSESRSSGTSPWMKQLRGMAKASFSRGSGGGGEPSTSGTKWSGLLSGKRSGSHSQDSKEKPKGMYKDFEALFGSK